MDKFPELARYLERLPDGLDSYPECLAKASLYRAVVDEAAIPEADLAELPATLIALQREPPPISSWVPEVHSHAMIVAVYDVVFDGDADRFNRFAYEQQRRLFDGPLYRIAFKLVSPGRLFRMATNRWRLFHRGVALEVLDLHDGGAKLRLDFPRGVYELVSLHGLCEGLRAALDVSSRGGARVTIDSHTEDSAVVSLRWRR